MARIFTLAANEEYEEYSGDDQQCIEECQSIAADARGEVTALEINRILRERPLYEVVFDFDADTGKCVAAYVDGIKLVAQ